MLVALTFAILLSLGLVAAISAFGYFWWVVQREQNRLMLEVVAGYGQIVKDYTTVPPEVLAEPALPMNMAAVGQTEYSENGVVASPVTVGDEDPMALLEEMWDEGKIGVTPHGKMVLDEIDEIEGFEAWKGDGG